MSDVPVPIQTAPSYEKKRFPLEFEWKKPKEDESLDVGSADFL